MMTRVATDELLKLNDEGKRRTDNVVNGDVEVDVQDVV